VLGGLAVAGIAADASGRFSSDRDRDDATDRPFEPVDSSELDVVDPTAGSELGQPTDPATDRQELGQPTDPATSTPELDIARDVRDTSEVDAPSDTADPTDPTTIRTTPELARPRERGQRRDRDSDRPTIGREDLVDERPTDPRQDPPSTRERQRREDLDPFEREFPGRENQIIGRGSVGEPSVDNGIGDRLAERRDAGRPGVGSRGRSDPFGAPATDTDTDARSRPRDRADIRSDLGLNSAAGLEEGLRTDTTLRTTDLTRDRTGTRQRTETVEPTRTQVPTTTTGGGDDGGRRRRPRVDLDSSSDSSGVDLFGGGGEEDRFTADVALDLSGAGGGDRDLADDLGL
jgi:hypothetical protein